MNFDYEHYDPFVEYKSYGDEDREFNPDDYESDFWEDIIPDVDEIADALDRQLEHDLYFSDEPYESDFQQDCYDCASCDSDTDLLDLNDDTDTGIPIAWKYAKNH